MMSSMFEIPILYVACGVKIVKKRRGVIFLLTCTSKNTVTKEIHVLAGFFFSKKNSFWKRTDEEQERDE